MSKHFPLFAEFDMLTIPLCYSSYLTIVLFHFEPLLSSKKWKGNCFNGLHATCMSMSTVCSLHSWAPHPYLTFQYSMDCMAGDWFQSVLAFTLFLWSSRLDLWWVITRSLPIDCWVLRIVYVLGHCSILYPDLCGVTPYIESKNTSERL